jgi:predicted RNA methylase
LSLLVPRPLGYDAERKQELGQFLTPETIAFFMASLFESCPAEIRLLDAGAGGGALSAALVKRLCRAERRPKRIAVTAYDGEWLPAFMTRNASAPNGSASKTI